MMTREQATAVLERGRPFLQAEGGDIELVAMQGNSATVRITGALTATHGNKARAAELLRMNRSTLVDRMNRCGLGRASAHEASELVSVPA